MKNFGICCLLLAAAALAPEPRPGTLDSAWSLGLLLSLAFVAQQVAIASGLPAIVGWMLAGLTLGEGGLRAVIPATDGLVELAYFFSALWLGCLLGLGLSWSRDRHTMRLPVTAAVSTAVALLLIAAGIAVVAGKPARQALNLAALTCLWGPVVASALAHRSEAVLVASFGAGTGLVLLSGVLVVAGGEGAFSPGAGRLVIELWASVLVGALAAELLWRLRLLARRVPAVVSLTSCFILVAFAGPDARLFPLLAGVGAGVVLAHHDGPGRLLLRLLEPSRGLAALAFFAIVGASINVRELVERLAPGVYEIVLVATGILIVLRGVAPAMWSPLQLGDSTFTWGTSWLMLPRGALLFEISLRPQGGVLELFTYPLATLAFQVITVDILLHTLLFSSLAVVVQRLVRGTPESEPEGTADAAVPQPHPTAGATP